MNEKPAIELILRCRTCGTECSSSATCDACGEGPVANWAPALNRYLSVEEAESIRRANREAEARRARRELLLGWARPLLQRGKDLMVAAERRYLRLREWVIKAADFIRAFWKPCGCLLMLAGLVTTCSLGGIRCEDSREYRTSGPAFSIRPSSPAYYSSETPVADDPAAGRPGFLMYPRLYHAATLLPGGDVLITGGEHHSELILDNAERYDPVEQRFVFIRSRMLQARRKHTATLMFDGKVLVAGGEGPVDRVAELYDTRLGDFIKTGRMAVWRCEHTGTRLMSGKVLLAGGLGEDGRPLASAELYDPVKGEFSTTGSMNIPRRGHEAFLLGNGKVLVAGGGSPVIEIFDPATGRWSEVEARALCAVMANFRASLLRDGKVLCAGPRALEIYDPATQAVTPLDLETSGQGWQNAVRLDDGRVLLVGTEKSVLFEPEQRSLSAGHTLIVPRVQATATLLPGGRVLVVGGMDQAQETILASAELFDPVRNVFIRPAPEERK